MTQSRSPIEDAVYDVKKIFLKELDLRSLSAYAQASKTTQTDIDNLFVIPALTAHERINPDTNDDTIKIRRAKHLANMLYESANKNAYVRPDIATAQYRTLFSLVSKFNDRPLKDKTWVNFYLGALYYRGLGTEPSPKEGLRFLIEALNQKDVRAAMELANLIDELKPHYDDDACDDEQFHELVGLCTDITRVLKKASSGNNHTATVKLTRLFSIFPEKYYSKKHPELFSNETKLLIEEKLIAAISANYFGAANALIQFHFVNLKNLHPDNEDIESDRLALLNQLSTRHPIPALLTDIQLYQCTAQLRNNVAHYSYIKIEERLKLIHSDLDLLDKLLSTDDQSSDPLIKTARVTFRGLLHVIKTYISSDNIPGVLSGFSNFSYLIPRANTDQLWTYCYKVITREFTLSYTSAAETTYSFFTFMATCMIAVAALTNRNKLDVDKLNTISTVIGETTVNMFLGTIEKPSPIAPKEKLTILSDLFHSPSLFGKPLLAIAQYRVRKQLITNPLSSDDVYLPDISFVWCTLVAAQSGDGKAFLALLTEPVNNDNSSHLRSYYYCALSLIFKFGIFSTKLWAAAAATMPCYLLIGALGTNDEELFKSSVATIASNLAFPELNRLLDDLLNYSYCDDPYKKHKNIFFNDEHAKLFLDRAVRLNPVAIREFIAAGKNDELLNEYAESYLQNASLSKKTKLLSTKALGITPHTPEAYAFIRQSFSNYSKAKIGSPQLASAARFLSCQWHAHYAKIIFNLLSKSEYATFDKTKLKDFLEELKHHIDFSKINPEGDTYAILTIIKRLTDIDLISESGSKYTFNV